MDKRNDSDKASLSNSVIGEALSSAIVSLFGTMSATISTTAVLVGLHHYYRKQQQPEARLQDYLSGLDAQLCSLSSSKIPHLQHTYQQAKLAYQRYNSEDFAAADTINTSNTINTNPQASDVSTSHTTTVISRPVCWVSGVAAMPKGLNIASSNASNDTSNADTIDNDFGVVGIDADRQIVWQTTMPERVHDIVVQPIIDNNQDLTPRSVVVMGRRPSECFWVLETATGQVKYAIKADTDRHFYGHACYSLDGLQLYVTENDTVSLEGKIGIYDATNGYQKIAEFDSHGIGPHELIIHPDAQTLIVANGGIKTEQASRAELNLDTMRPSLVYLNRHNGELLEQVTPEHNQMSIRHLAMHDDGTVMIGIQFQGERHINVPLVLTHKRGDVAFTPLIMPNNQWQRFHQYIASVTVDSQNNLLCVTTPIGGCAAIYDLTTRQLIDDVRLPDCAGASVMSVVDSQNATFNDKGNASLSLHTKARTKKSANDESYQKDKRQGFIVSDGQGQLTALYANGASIVHQAIAEQNVLIYSDSKGHKMSFDNHLQAL